MLKKCLLLSPDWTRGFVSQVGCRWAQCTCTGEPGTYSGLWHLRSPLALSGVSVVGLGEYLLTLGKIHVLNMHLILLIFLPLTDKAKLFLGIGCLSELLMNCCSFHFLMNYCLLFCTVAASIHFCLLEQAWPLEEERLL